MRTEVSIRGILFAAAVAMCATTGKFLIPNGREVAWLCLFAASLLIFFTSLPDDRVRERERE